MNANKETEYIAEIVRLKSLVKQLASKPETIKDVNQRLKILDTTLNIQWDFRQPSLSKGANIGLNLLPNYYNPPKIIAFKKELIE